MASSYFKLMVLRKTRRNKQIKSQKPLETAIEDKLLLESDVKLGISSNKCRVCLKEGCISIYNNGENVINIPEAICELGGIEMSVVDPYPKHLCDACYSLLQSAVKFRKMAQVTNEVLRQMPQNISDSDVVDNESFNGNTKEVIQVSNSNKYNCKTCKMNFESYNEYIRHKNLKQHKNVRIQCPICFGLLTAQLYKKHLARHQSATHLICDVCGKLYRKDNLIRHLQLHSYELPYQCQVCPYRGRFMDSLKIHMRTHTGQKPFACNVCELHFLTRSNLNRHLLIHKKERPFKCVECGRGFYTRRDMEIHFKSDHAGIKDFDCKMCGNKYGTRKALMRHELRIHKRDKMAKGRMPLYLQEEYRKADEMA